MQPVLDTLYNIAKLVLGDPRSRVAKLLIIAGIALVAAPWWQPLLQAAAVKYLDLPAEQLIETDRAMLVSGWVLIVLGIALYVYATAGSNAMFTTTGGLSFIEGDSAILCDTLTKNAGVVSVKYFPEMASYPQYADCTRFRIELDGQFFNDTDTQRTLQNPIIEFWGVEGLRLTANNPAFDIFDANRKEWIRNDATRTISVPARDMTRIRFELGLGMNFAETGELVEDMYDGTVALLKVKMVNGGDHRFRICTYSFAGPEKVVWPHDRKYPIYNLLALNAHGRRAGRRPQTPKPLEAPTEEPATPET